MVQYVQMIRRDSRATVLPITLVKLVMWKKFVSVGDISITKCVLTVFCKVSKHFSLIFLPVLEVFEMPSCSLFHKPHTTRVFERFRYFS